MTCIVGAMFTAPDLKGVPKPQIYEHLAEQLRGLIGDEPDAIANMANCAALIFHSLPQLNWAGFYLLRGDTLVLGPFQGRPACIRIPLGRGVCGKAAQQRVVLRVGDVNKFDDHIACDSASQSEIVLPLIKSESQLLGVLDIDSPELNRFDDEDEAGLTTISQIVAAKL